MINVEQVVYDLLVIKNEMSHSKEPFYLFFKENFIRRHYSSSTNNQSNTCTNCKNFHGKLEIPISHQK